MFGPDSEREDVTKIVASSMEHIIPRLRFSHGRSAPKIMNHPYFLGYVKGLSANCVLLYAPRFKLDSCTLRSIVQDVIRVVFGHEGPVALKRMLELEQQGNSEFNKGVRNGKITSDVFFDNLDANLPDDCQGSTEDSGMWYYS